MNVNEIFRWSRYGIYPIAAAIVNAPHSGLGVTADVATPRWAQDGGTARGVCSNVGQRSDAAVRVALTTATLEQRSPTHSRLNRFPSSRRLERECQRNVVLMADGTSRTGLQDDRGIP